MTNPVERAISHFGGIPNVQKMLGISYVAIKKWQDKGYFPRTEYTGETNYTQVLAEASNGAFTAGDLLPLYPNKNP